MPDEKRRHLRHALSGATCEFGDVVNISRSGLGVRLEGGTPEPGRHRITLQGSPAVAVRVERARIHDDVVGLIFVETTAGHDKLVDRIVAAHAASHDLKYAMQPIWFGNVVGDKVGLRAQSNLKRTLDALEGHAYDDPPPYIPIFVLDVEADKALTAKELREVMDDLQAADPGGDCERLERGRDHLTNYIECLKRLQGMINVRLEVVQATYEKPEGGRQIFLLWVVRPDGQPRQAPNRLYVLWIQLRDENDEILL